MNYVKKLQKIILDSNKLDEADLNLIKLPERPLSLNDEEKHDIVKLLFFGNDTVFWLKTIYQICEKKQLCNVYDVLNNSNYNSVFTLDFEKTFNHNSEKYFKFFSCQIKNIKKENYSSLFPFLIVFSDIEKSKNLKNINVGRDIFHTFLKILDKGHTTKHLSSNMIIEKLSYFKKCFSFDKMEELSSNTLFSALSPQFIKLFMSAFPEVNNGSYLAKYFENITSYSEMISVKSSPYEGDVELFSHISTNGLEKSLECIEKSKAFIDGKDAYCSQLHQYIKQTIECRTLTNSFGNKNIHKKTKML